MRANSFLIDGKVVGLIGVVRHPDKGVFFSEVSSAMQPYLKSITVWRAIVDSIKIVKQYRGPVLSIADCAEGCVNLQRLGFTHLYGGWWGWL